VIAAVKKISKQEAIDRKMFGPVYHGTSRDRGRIHEEGFKVYVGDSGSSDLSHGYPNQPYQPGGRHPAPVHHLGYGIYFTTVKAIAKKFQGDGKGMAEYYLDVPRLETINFGSPNTMMKWWVSQGYDLEMSLKDRVKATEKLTDTLKSKWDAVWFKGQGIRKLLDGDQIVVFDPANIYLIDPTLSKAGEVGSKIKRLSDGMTGVLLGHRKADPKYHNGATKLLEVKWKKGGRDYNVYEKDIEYIGG
jgi:hypothetical protein